MPEIIATTVYQFHELSDGAKDQARTWYREGACDDDWHDFVFEGFETICNILGVTLKTQPVCLMGGGTRSKPCIWFRGFWSQGDGACFEGLYAYRNGTSKAIRAHAPTDATLHLIADTLQALQRRNFYQLHVAIQHRGHYTHEYCMVIDVERDSPHGQEDIGNAEDIVTEGLRDLARWLYRQLEREYEYLTSDEVVDETITANAYTFTNSGRRFG